MMTRLKLIQTMSPTVLTMSQQTVLTMTWTVMMIFHLPLLLAGPDPLVLLCATRNNLKIKYKKIKSV